MVKKNTPAYLFILLLLIAFSSCNVSLNILNRKYRPGFSVNFSKKQNQKIDHAIEKNKVADIFADTEVIENKNNELIASSNNSERFINNYKAPINDVFACDTPPKKKMDDPNWSLYKEKEPNPKGNSKWKPIEPVNLVSFFVLLGGVLIASFIPAIVAWFVFLIFLAIIILSIISLVRIKKNPNKYSKFSKVFDWVFISLGIGLLALSLIALIVILASVA